MRLADEAFTSLFKTDYFRSGQHSELVSPPKIKKTKKTKTKMHLRYKARESRKLS